MLFALAAVLIVMTGIVNLESTVGPLILIVPVGLGLVARAGYRARSRRVELGWAGRTRPDIGSIPRDFDDRRGLPLVAPARRAVDRRRVASALGRFESVRMLSSPWFGAGLGFLVVLTVLYGVFLARDKELSTFDSVAFRVGASYEFAQSGWRFVKKGTVNLFFDRIEFKYDDFRDARVSRLPSDNPNFRPAGTEPLYEFGANVIQLFVSVWF